ncbi:hypothetical protein Bca4012_093587 [Brassica carinata]
MDLDGIISTKQTVNYESKRRAVDSNTPVSFSIRVREVELRFVRDGSVLRENLLKHRTIASPVIGLEIPPCFAEVMLLRPCLRQSYPPGFNRSSFLKSAKTPLRRRAKEVVVKYQPNQIVQSAYKILVLGVSSPSCAAATTIFTGIVFSCGWAASLHVLLVILSKIRSLLSRHNDEQPLNITGQLILRGQNGYFQSGQEGEACIITEQSLRRDFLKVLQKSFHQTSQSISPSTTRRPSLLIREAIKDPLLNALKPKYFYQVRKRRTSPESLTNTLLLHKEFGQNKSEAKKIAERSKSQSHQMQTVQSNIRWLTETELSAGPDTPLAVKLSFFLNWLIFSFYSFLCNYLFFLFF